MSRLTPVAGRLRCRYSCVALRQDLPTPITSTMLEAVLPFQCEECGVQVNPSAGGMCFGCNRMLCSEHFTMRPPDRERATRPEFECRRCQSRALERTGET